MLPVENELDSKGSSKEYMASVPGVVGCQTHCTYRPTGLKIPSETKT